MKTLKAILVDDEPNCCESLEWQLKHYCPNVSVVAICHTVESAIQKIQEEKPDILFLDIQLQDATGFDLLSKLETIDFNVVFVTAFEDYAIKAIRFNALDYLLKPVIPEELRRAVESASTTKQKPTLSGQMLDYFNEISNRQSKEIKRIVFSTSETLHFVNVADIVYCKSESNYTQIVQKGNQKILLSKTLKSIEELLDRNLFFRVHASYLVNLNRITKYIRSDGVIVMDDNSSVPVAQAKKEELIKIMSQS